MTVRWVGYIIGAMLAPWACLCVIGHALAIWAQVAWETLRDRY
jgi:hypothetical protein